MAKRSHPPTVLTLARRTIRESELFGRGHLVLCAISGGPDSTCLLHVLAHLRKSLGHEVAAAGVDHGLRAEARSELDGAETLATALGVPFQRLSVRVEPGSNLQARARTARHAVLQRCASGLGAHALALGHTADDRAETLLIRLLRGAGPRGLAVMPPVAPGIEGDVRIVRPLLEARREAVAAHLTRHDLSFSMDPSNLDRRFLRVRVRHELVPLLEDLSPQLVPHLCSLAEMLGDVTDADRDPWVGLGKAQQRDLRRVLKQGLRGASTGITLRLQGGREMVVHFRKRS